MLTVEEVLDQALAKECPSCGSALGQPGTQCLSCGSLPEMTREEAAEQLAVPGVLEKLHAEKLREEARQWQLLIEQKLTEADRIVLKGQLHVRLEQAQERLQKAQEGLNKAGEGLAEAIGKLDDAVAPVREAEAFTERARRNEEASMRTKQPTEVQVEASWRLTKAEGILAERKADHAVVHDLAMHAQVVSDRAASEVQAAEVARDEAASLVGAHLEFIPMSPETIKV